MSPPGRQDGTPATKRVGAEGSPSSLRLELRDAVELWLVPGLLALLPYRLGIALARLVARTLPLYGETAAAAAAQWRSVTGVRASDPDWATAYRFAQLVDHLDLFWAITRSRRFLLRRLATPVPAVVPGEPVLVLSYHFGQGLWLLHWLAAAGAPARFVAAKMVRESARSSLQWLYQRLRNAMVERLAQVKPIFVGGARSEIARTLEAGGAVYGLIDVPGGDAGRPTAVVALFGQPVALPTGLLDAARNACPRVLVVTAHARPDGSRAVHADRLGRLDEVTIGGLASLLERRLVEAPSAWHFWHLWPWFAPQPR